MAAASGALGPSTEAYPGGMSLTYGRTDIGQLSTISDGTTTLGSYTDVGTREKGVTFGSGATQANTYSGFRQEVTSIHHQDSGTGTLVRMDYGYNAVHDRTYERYGASGSSGDAFEYDKMGRLSKAWMGSSQPSSPSGQTYVETLDFNMDDDGNRTSKVLTPYGSGAVSTSYTTNGLNQYTAVGGASLTYDGNGNLIDDGTYYYEYDYRNQLIEAGHSGGSVIATYRYDAMGRRGEKNVAGPGITRFILSGLEVVETCAGQTTWAQSFVYADGIDHIVALRQADVLDVDADMDTSELVWNYYHRNALGSVMFISEQDETEAATYRYTPYGEMKITRGGSTQGTDPLGQDVGYTGRWYGAEAGHWHFRAREYSSALGRFLQRDPLHLLPGPNAYQYVDSSPSTLLDPLGLFTISPIGRDVGPNPPIRLPLSRWLDGWEPGSTFQPPTQLPPAPAPAHKCGGPCRGEGLAYDTIAVGTEFGSNSIGAFKGSKEYRDFVKEVKRLAREDALAKAGMTCKPEDACYCKVNPSLTTVSCQDIRIDRSDTGRVSVEFSCTITVSGGCRNAK